MGEESDGRTRLLLAPAVVAVGVGLLYVVGAVSEAEALHSDGVPIGQVSLIPVQQLLADGISIGLRALPVLLLMGLIVILEMTFEHSRGRERRGASGTGAVSPIDAWGRGLTPPRGFRPSMPSPTILIIALAIAAFVQGVWGAAAWLMSFVLFSLRPWERGRFKVSRTSALCVLFAMFVILGLGFFWPAQRLSDTKIELREGGTVLGKLIVATDGFWYVHTKSGDTVALPSTTIKRVRIGNTAPRFPPTPLSVLTGNNAFR